MNRRMGFSLVEMMIVVAIASLLVLIGLPRVRQGMAQSNVRGARTTVVNMLAKARAGATQSGRRTWLKFNGTTVVVIARPRRTVGGAGADPADTLGALQNLSTQYGVTVNTTADSIQFDPRGLASGFAPEGATITVAKGSHTNQIKVDALGRITQ